VKRDSPLRYYYCIGSGVQYCWLSMIFHPSRQRPKGNWTPKRHLCDRRRCQGNKAVNTSFIWNFELEVKNLPRRKRCSWLIN
jgi:hypothetical protein